MKYMMRNNYLRENRQLFKHICSAKVFKAWLLHSLGGGIIEIIDDIKNTKLNVYEIMQKAQARQSFMGCSLKVST